MIRLGLLSAYAIAMAYVEAVVVVYLRRLLLPEGDLEAKIRDLAALENLLRRHQIVWTEQTREAATIVMLAAVSYLSGKTWRQKGAFFLWTFALWDIFYYVFLQALIEWPGHLGEWDVLFLIPCPWVSPVWVPLAISCLMLGVSVWLLRGKDG